MKKKKKRKKENVKIQGKRFGLALQVLNNGVDEIVGREQFGVQDGQDRSENLFTIPTIITLSKKPK